MGQIPDEVEIRAVRDTENVKHVCIPAAPSEGEIADTDLLDVQGGTTPAFGWFVSAAAIISFGGSAALTATLVAK